MVTNSLDIQLYDYIKYQQSQYTNEKKHYQSEFRKRS